MRNKRERFVALAEARTEKALKSIRLLSNLANRANYEYSEEDVNQIVRAIELEVRNLRSAFSTQGSLSKTFRLNNGRRGK